MPTLGTSGPPPATSGDEHTVRVFMSYRRSDDANFTGRFHDKLIGVFGEENVFRDIDSIPAGTRFQDVITDHLAGVDAVLALIGPTWGARLNAPEDFVRMEIAHAIGMGTPVIPVLIEDTPLPERAALPEELQPLVDRHTVRVRRDPDFHRDAARVIDGVRQAVAARRAQLEQERRAAEAAEAARREEEEQRRALEERRHELRAELEQIEARAAEERRLAEQLEAERAARLAELARLEQTAQPPATEDRPVGDADRPAPPTLADVDAAPIAEPPPPVDDGRVRPPDIDVVNVDGAVAPGNQYALADREPSTEAGESDEDGTRTRSGRRAPRGHRTVSSASRDEVIGGALLLVATAWAVQALFDKADGTNAFAEAWSTDVLAVLLTAGLLVPLVVFWFDGPVAPVSVGTSTGYVAYQGLGDAQYFTYRWDGVAFPTNIVLIGVLLAGAWFMFRRAQQPLRPVLAPPLSRWLQLAAGVAAGIAILLLCNKMSDENDPDWYLTWVLLVVGVGLVALSARQSREAAIAVISLAGVTAVSYLAYAIAYDEIRDRALNVTIVTAVLTGIALWRVLHRAPAATTAPVVATAG